MLTSRRRKKKRFGKNRKGEKGKAGKLVKRGIKNKGVREGKEKGGGVGKERRRRRRDEGPVI